MNLNQVTVPALDIEKSAAFYRDLGLVQIVSAPHYARFECPDGSATFSIHKVDRAPADPQAIVYFECADLDARVASLRKKGFEFSQLPADQPWLWREARLSDPSGNPLCLYWAGENRKNPPWRIDAREAGVGDMPARTSERMSQALRPPMNAVSLLPVGRDGTLRGYAGTLPALIDEVLRATVHLYEGAGFVEPWICYVAVADGILVGTCGFKSPPRDGRVEIAYFTFPEAEGRGIATAMAAELVAIAASYPVDVTAQTLPARNPSHRVLEKLGFRHVDTIEHPEDGTVWEWCLARTGA